MASEETPKIIIDSDWKSQAQAEKDRLAAKASAKPAAAATGGMPIGTPGLTPPGGNPDPSRGGGAEAEPHGPPGFQDLLSVLYTQAVAYMGGFPDPKTGRAMVALDLAKLHIDLLAVLQEKTKGNLSEQESSLLTRVLSELRLEFVEITKEVAKAVQEGRAQSVPGGGANPSLNLRPGM